MIRIILSSDPKMFSRYRERIERSEVSGLATHFHIELGPNTPNEFRLAARRRKHSSKE